MRQNTVCNILGASSRWTLVSCPDRVHVVGGVMLMNSLAGQPLHTRRRGWRDWPARLVESRLGEHRVVEDGLKISRCSHCFYVSFFTHFGRRTSSRFIDLGSIPASYCALFFFFGISLSLRQLKRILRWLNLRRRSSVSRAVSLWTVEALIKVSHATLLATIKLWCCVVLLKPIASFREH